MGIFLKDDEEINDYGILDRFEYLMCKMHYLIYCGIDLKYIEDLFNRASHFSGSLFLSTKVMEVRKIGVFQ